MATNDTISDMLTRLRNASMAKHPATEVPDTRMTRNIAAVLDMTGIAALYVFGYMSIAHLLFVEKEL